MSKRYSLAAIAAAFMLAAGPAWADGYPDRPVQKGPPPLQAHIYENGCELIGGDDWYCPPDEIHETQVRRYVDESKTRHYVTRYTTGGICCTPQAAPPPPRPVYHAPAPRGLVIDVASFGGGVGSGVDGGYYGGGGGFAYASASASASARASASMRLAFRGGFKGGHKGRRGGKKGGGGCGCR
ncbi:MAG: hypothetical protein RIB03_06150 [Henriciella sp.]|uniref:hypothetical protein n=1 Tax=Henriciella sp. TaxID=1968823 RepID=UPI0032ED0E98